MTVKALALTQEVAALIGVCLFAFGLWQIYTPASYLFIGSILIAPFVFSIRGRS